MTETIPWLHSAVLVRLAMSLVVLSWVLGARAESAEGEPQSAVDSVQREVARIAGTWIGFSYDHDGVFGQKFRNREGIRVAFSENPNEKAPVLVSLRKTRLWKIDLFNREAAGFGISGGGRLDVSGPMGTITIPGDEETTIVENPTILVYRLQGDILSLRVLDNGQGERVLTADKGDGRIVFHLRRKPGGKKSTQRIPTVK